MQPASDLFTVACHCSLWRNIFVCVTAVRTIQRRGDGGGGGLRECEDEVFQFTANTKRLHPGSANRNSTVFRFQINNANQQVYVANIVDTNLLLVVVDGRRPSAATVSSSQRYKQQFPQIFDPVVNSTSKHY